MVFNLHYSFFQEFEKTHTQYTDEQKKFKKGTHRGAHMSHPKIRVKSPPFRPKFGMCVPRNLNLKIYIFPGREIKNKKVLLHLEAPSMDKGTL